MTRRAFVPATLGVAATTMSAADSPKPGYLEIRRYQLRNSTDNQRQRTTDFLRQQAAAFARAGAGPVGAFASSIAPNTPFLLTVVAYPTASAIEDVAGKLASDAAYQQAVTAYNGQPGLNYERME